MQIVADAMIIIYITIIVLLRFLSFHNLPESFIKFNFFKSQILKLGT